jgi:surfeit locus 1 family protein
VRHPSTRALVGFVLLAAALGALFIRLGVWQLERRAERQRANARVEAQLRQPPTPLPAWRREAGVEHQRVSLEGTPDTANEFAVMGRTRNGSPGVYLLTPMHVAGMDRPVLVNRGWVYYPDAASVDFGRWRESRRTFTGYTQRLPDSSASAHFVKGRALRPLDRSTVSRLVPYAVDSVYVVALDSGEAHAPVRQDLPPLDEGPHLSYAIQWFSFAAIALIGAAVVVQRTRRAGNAGSTGA